MLQKAIYNNDEFIDNFGKLFHGTYYVTTKDNKEEFLTDDKEIF